VKALMPHLEQFLMDLKREHGFVGRVPFWLDRIEIGEFKGSDDELRHTLGDAIDRCIALIAFESPGYYTSDYCRLEWHHMKNTSPRWVEFDYQMSIVWKRGDDPPFNDPHFARRDPDLKHHLVIDLPITDNQQGRLGGVDWYDAVKKTGRFLGRCYEHRMERWRCLRPE